MTARVLVLGGFGRGDAGAESRLDALHTALADVDLVVASDTPAATEATHGCAAVRLSPYAVARVARQVEGVVVAGGDLLGATSEGQPDWRTAAAAIAAARTQRTPTVLLGVGVAGRVRPRLDAAVIRTADLVLLRDAESASLLVAAGVPGPMRVAADPAWWLADGVVPPTGDGVGTTVVVDGSLGARHAHDLADSLDAIEGHTRVLPWRDDSVDRRFAEELGRRCDDTEVADPPSRPADVVAAVADARLVVTHRAHGAIAAAAQGRRLLGVGARPEVAGVARSVGQPYVPSHAAPAVLGRAVARAAAGDNPSPAAVGELVKRIDDAFALTRLVLGLDDVATDVGAHLALEGGPPSW